MRFDKRVTFAFVFALLVQTGGALIWAGAAAERLAMVETEVKTQRDTAERLVRVETELKAMRSQLDRIERKIDSR